MLDRLDSRVLGGVQVVDHITGQTIRDGISFRNTQLQFGPTVSGVWAIRAAPGFEGYTDAFDPVPAVVEQDFSYEIHDLKRRYLPMSGQITLPRSLESAQADTRVDTPVRIALASAAGRRAVAGWTVMSVSVVDQNGAPVRGALVRALERVTDAELGWSMTGPNGMAQLPLTGITHLSDAPDDGDADTVDLITAVTRVRIHASVDIAQPWPADADTMRAGGPDIREILNAETSRLKAGGTAQQTVELNLT
jgi:hypothetical protein